MWMASGFNLPQKTVEITMNTFDKHSFVNNVSQRLFLGKKKIWWTSLSIDGLLLSVILVLTFAGITDDRKTTPAMTTAADGTGLSSSSEVTHLCPRSVGGACDVLGGRAWLEWRSILQVQRSESTGSVLLVVQTVRTQTHAHQRREIEHLGNDSDRRGWRCSQQMKQQHFKNKKYSDNSLGLSETSTWTQQESWEREKDAANMFNNL